MIDKDLVKKRFCRSIRTYNENAFVQKRVVQNIFEMMQENVDFSNINKAFEFGCGTGLLTDKLSFLASENIHINDIVADSCDLVGDRLNIPKCNRIIGDIEKIEVTNIFDLVISTSSIQWISDIKSLFRKIYGLVSQQGYFIFSTFGNDNIYEISELLGAGLNYRSITDIENKIRPYFQVIKSVEYTDKIYFKSVMEVLKHLKYTGVNSISNMYLTKKKLNDFSDKYHEFMEDGKYPLTYKPMLFICKK